MTPSDNSIQAIHPYYHEGLWVFDDAAVDLVKEPFVGGADRIMDVISEQVPDGKNGFTLVFSSRPFPGHQITLECPASLRQVKILSLAPRRKLWA